MERFDDAMELWKKEAHKKINSALNKEDVVVMIKRRIKSQKQIVAGYALSSWVWQFIFYALAVNLIVYAGSNSTFLLIALAGIAMYVPFTVAYARFCQTMIKNTNAHSAVVDTIALDIKNQYQNLNRFFNFKRKFDLIGIPVTGVFITTILIALNFIPPVSVSPLSAAIVFVLYFSAFIAATYYENRKRFKNPLKELDAVLKELGEENGD